MAVSADGMALIFRIIGKGGSEAAAEIMKPAKAAEQVKAATKDTFTPLGQSADRALPSVSNLRSGLGAALPIIATVAGAATAAAAAIFGMAKKASDAGSEIFDLEAKTGLGAESLSTLKFAAEQSGASVQDAAQAFVIYQNKLTDAAAKGKDLFGIDARKALADQEYALRALVNLLNGPLPAGFSRSSLAAELMGRSGASLLATFDTIGPSFDRFIAQAKRMGVVLSEEDVRAADEFGDSLTVLETQFGALSNKLALQYAPDITAAMKVASEGIADNKDLIVASGKAIGLSIQGIIEQLRTWRDEMRFLQFSATGLLDAVTNQRGFGRAVGNAAGLFTGETPEGTATPAPTRGGPAKPGEPSVVSEADATKTQQSVFERSQRKADAMLAEANKAAEIAARAAAVASQATATAADAAFSGAIKRAEELFKQSGDYLTFIQATKQAEFDRWEARKREFADEREHIHATTESEELRAAELRVNQAKEKAAEDEYKYRVRELDEQVTARHLAELQKRHARELELFDLRATDYIEKQKALAQAEVISYAEAQRRITAEQAGGLNKRREYMEAEAEAAKNVDAATAEEYAHQLQVLGEKAAAFVREAGGAATSATIDDLERLQRKIAELNEELDRLSLTRETPGVDPNAKFSQVNERGPWVDPASVGIAPAIPQPGFLEPFLNELKSGQDFVSGFGGVVASTFGGMTRAIGQAAAAAMVYGQSFGQAMKLALKAAMASIAAEAVVQAIVNTAKGFAALAGFMPQSAAHYFAAAGLWTAAGVAAGAVGAAIGGGAEQTESTE